MTASDSETTKIALHDIAIHAFNLAMGLQNAAPPQSTPGPSVQYLKEISMELESISQKIAEFNS